MKLILLPLSLFTGYILALALCDLWQSVAGTPERVLCDGGEGMDAWIDEVEKDLTKSS